MKHIPIVYWNEQIQKYVVNICSHYGHMRMDTRWMYDDRIGEEGYILDVDQVDEQYEFDTLEEVIDKFGVHKRF